MDLIANFFLLWDQPITLGALFLAGLLLREHKIFGTALMLAGFSMILNPALKEYFHMLRPGESGEYGFPSGHFSGAYSFYGWLLISYSRPAIRLALAFLLVGLAYSIVYMGYHYPQDIAGAFFFVSLTLGATHMLLNREPFMSKPHLLGCVLVALSTLPLFYMYMHTGIQKHSWVGLATIMVVTLMGWKLFPRLEKKA